MPTSVACAFVRLQVFARCGTPEPYIPVTQSLVARVGINSGVSCYFRIHNYYFLVLPLFAIVCVVT